MTKAGIETRVCALPGRVQSECAKRGHCTHMYTNSHVCVCVCFMKLINSEHAPCSALLSVLPRGRVGPHPSAWPCSPAPEAPGRVRGAERCDKRLPPGVSSGSVMTEGGRGHADEPSMVHSQNPGCFGLGAQARPGDASAPARFPAALLAEWQPHWCLAQRDLPKSRLEAAAARLGRAVVCEGQGWGSRGQSVQAAAGSPAGRRHWQPCWASSQPGQ